MRKLCLFVASAVLIVVTAAQAQDYPTRLIRLMHGFPPGGNVDVVARLMAQEMSKGLRQTILVESKPGQAGSIAAETIATSAEPDGYTILLVAGAHPAIGAVFRKLKYNPVDDFAWISTVSSYPFLLCVRKDSKFKTLEELFAAARAKPDSVTSGTAGIGSISHMSTELINGMIKAKILSVPYRGEAPALTGVLTGDVDFSITTTTGASPHIKSGAVRALGVTSKTRWKDLPDVPAVAEAGLPDFDVISWSGFAAPPKTPKPIIDRLHKEILRAIAVPEVRTRLEAFGAEVGGSTPAEMRDLVARQLKVWTKVAKEANIQLD
jgi:tripartite-type tricarboxylate transporter receptor subunit TctC